MPSALVIVPSTSPTHGRCNGQCDPGCLEPFTRIIAPGQKTMGDDTFWILADSPEALWEQDVAGLNPAVSTNWG